MSIKTDLLIVLGLLASYFDWRSGKIYNWFTVPIALVACVLAAVHGGWAELGMSLGGWILGGLFFGILFWVQMMGGGDVKLLAAFGAIGGPRYVCEVAVLAVLLGGVWAIFDLLKRSALKQFIFKMGRFIRSLLIKELVVDFPHVNPTWRIPFGIPLSAAAWTVWSWY